MLLLLLTCFSMINESSLSEKLLSVLCSSGEKNVALFWRGTKVYSRGRRKANPGVNKREACSRVPNMCIKSEQRPRSLPGSWEIPSFALIKIPQSLLHVWGMESVQDGSRAETSPKFRVLTLPVSQPSTHIFSSFP